MRSEKRKIWIRLTRILHLRKNQQNRFISKFSHNSYTRKMTQKINLENNLRLMVALDLTEMDPILLQYVNFLCEVWNIEHLYFTHNIKQYKLYDLYDECLEEGITLEDIVDRGLQKTIDNYYTASVPNTVIITTDDYTESILSHLAKEYRIDIMVLGNKD